MTLRLRRAIVQQAIHVVRHHLECLPPLPNTGDLYASIDDCIRETMGWTVSSVECGQDRLMKRILALHVEVRKLEEARGDSVP